MCINWYSLALLLFAACTAMLPASGKCAEEVAPQCARIWELLQRARTKADVDLVTTRYQAALRYYGTRQDFEGQAEAMWGLGSVCLRQGKLRPASEYFEKSLDRAGKSHHSGLESKALNGKGLICLFQGRLDEARKQFEQSLELARQIGDLKRKAGALHCTAMCLRFCGNYAQAQKTAEQALDACRICRDRIGECDSLSNLGAALSAQSKLDLAKVHFQNALTIARAAGYRWGEGWTLFSLADIAWRSKEYVQAVKHGSASLEIATTLGYDGLAAHSSNCLGLAFMDSGQLDKARTSYDSARSLAAQVGLPALSGWVENNTGYMLLLQRKYHAAQSHLNKALDIATQYHNQNQFTTVRANLTKVYMASGRFEDLLELAGRPLPKPPCGKEPHADVTKCVARMASGDIGSALECAKLELKKARESKDTNSQINALIILVMARYHSRMGEEAEKYLQELEELANTADDPEEKVMALGALASVLSSLGRRGKAAEILDRWGNAAADIKNPQMKLTALAIVGTAFYFQKNYNKALTIFQEATGVARQIREPSPVIPLIGFCLGRIQLRLGNDAAAIAAFQMSVTGAQFTRNRFAESLALSALAERFLLVGHYQEALEKYVRALKLAEQISNPLGQASALQGMAEVYESLGDYSRAIECSQKALDSRTVAQDVRGKLYSQREKALYSLNLNDSDAALQQLTKVIEQDQKNSLRSTTSTVLAYIGQLWARRGEGEEVVNHPAAAKECFAKAEKCFQEALKMSEIEGNQRWTHNAVGLYYLDRRDLDKAESHLTLSGYSSSLGRLYLAKRDYRLAREQFERMLSTPQQQLRVDSVFVANTGLGRSFEGLQDYTQAAKHYRLAIDTVETLRAIPVEGSRLRFMSRTVNVFPRSEPYKGLAKVLFLSSVYKQSLEASESCKARTLADILAEGMPQGSLPSNLRTRDAKCHADLRKAAEAEVEAMVKNDPPSIRKARTSIKRTREALLNHINDLWRNKQTKPYAMARYPRPLKLEEVDVKPGEAIVVYEVSDQDLFIYLVTNGSDGNQVRGIRKAGKGRPYLMEIIKKFRAPFEFPTSEKLADQEVTFDFASARELYRLLVADVMDLCEKTDGWKRQIIVVPDDHLATVPFDALVTSRGGSVVRENGTLKTVDATFLLDRASISYAQSLATLTMARAAMRSRQHGSGTLLFYYSADCALRAQATKKESSPSQRGSLGNNVGANPDSGTVTKSALSLSLRVPLPSDLQFSPLTEGERLRRELQKTFEHEAFKGDKNRGREWFRAGAKSGFLDKDNIFLYTHGIFRPELPGPALAVHYEPKYRDQLLSFSDVMASRRLKADLVVLAACQAGLGHYISGEGIMGMSAAIQYSWASRVLTTLWEVPEYSTFEMVKSLATYLCIPDSDKRTAFEAARQQVRHRWNHPYYWAPFMFVGPPDKAPKEASQKPRGK